MSHFTVLCRLTPAMIEEAGDLNEALTRLLDPYYEQHEDTSPYMEWQDQNDELLDGHATFEEALKAHNDEERAHSGKWDNGSERKRCIYDTVEEWIDQYHGYREIPDKPGHYGYTRNPNAKWDWWVVGGRWQGLIPVRPDADSAVIGESGVMDSHHSRENNTASACQLKDLDTDKIAFEEEQKVKAEARQYEAFWTALGDHVANIPDDKMIRERREDPMPRIFTKEGTLAALDHLLTAYKESADNEKLYRTNIMWTLRELYHMEHPGTELERKKTQRHMKKTIEAALTIKDAELWEQHHRHGSWRGGFLNDLREAGLGTLIKVSEFKEDPAAVRDKYHVLIPWNESYIFGVHERVSDAEFIKQMAPYESFGTYAVLDEHGEWHSKGSMGWWGMGSDTPETAREFHASYREKFLTGDPETWIVVVDCHI